MKKIFKSIVTLIFCLCIFAMYSKDTYATNISINMNSVINITDNDARIEGSISNPDKAKITETGFYLGTSSGSLSKCSKKDTGSWPYKTVTVGFTMSQYWGSLQAGTTYFYKFYAIVNGQEYQSGEGSFTTTGGQPAPQNNPAPSKAGISFHSNVTKSITDNDGRIEAQISNPNGRNVTETGFYIGTDAGSISKNSNCDRGSWRDGTIYVGYTMSRYYGSLQAGTTYYYAFYAVGDGTEYRSDTYSFKTTGSSNVVQEPAQVPTPTPTPARPAPQEQNNTPTISFSSVTAKDITTENAVLSGVIVNNDRQVVTETGYYLGNNKCPEHDTGSWNYKTITMNFSISKYSRQCLLEGKTYSYQLYAIVNGQEVRSEQQSFTTTVSQKPATSAKNITASFKDVTASNVTDKDARFSGVISNPDKQKVIETGVYVNGSKCASPDKGTWTNSSISVGFNYSKYFNGNLQPNTSYKYKLYAIVDGEEITSEEKNIATKGIGETSAEIMLPTATPSVSGNGKYPSIDWWNENCWVVQPKGSQGCYVASLAMCNMLLKQGDYINISVDSAYQKLKSENNNSENVSASIRQKYGYTSSKDNPSLENIYDALKLGPVICYKSFDRDYYTDNGTHINTPSQHYSVIVGYKGPSDSLSKGGFIIKDVAADSSVRSGKTNYEKWMAGTVWNGNKYEYNVGSPKIIYR